MLLAWIGQQEIHVRGRVVDHLRENDRPGRSQRPSRPPKVERRGMSVPDRFLPRRRLVDGVERQRHLDQFLVDARRGHSETLVSLAEVNRGYETLGKNRGGLWLSPTDGAVGSRH